MYLRNRPEDLRRSLDMAILCRYPATCNLQEPRWTSAFDEDAPDNVLSRTSDTPSLGRAQASTSRCVVNWVSTRCKWRNQPAQLKLPQSREADDQPHAESSGLLVTV